VPLPQPGTYLSTPERHCARGSRNPASQQLCGEAVAGDSLAGVSACTASSDAASALSAVLARAGILDRAALQALLPLASHLRLVEYSRGETICDAGSAEDRLHIIASGAIKLSRQFPNGRTLLTIMGPPDVLGVQAVVDHGQHICGATAVTTAHTVSVDAVVFRDAVRRNPELAELFLRMLARQARRSDEDLTDMTCTDGPGRIAKRVLQLAEWFGTPENGALRINHNLTQYELAELVGSSRETVNKSLSNFAHRGWIQLDRQSVLIHNPERLAWRAR
jgi:CRP/FNR family transcriptional regulator, cyclic AMP receptor protein